MSIFFILKNVIGPISTIHLKCSLTAKKGQNSKKLLFKILFQVFGQFYLGLWKSMLQTRELWNELVELYGLSYAVLELSQRP